MTVRRKIRGKSGVLLQTVVPAAIGKWVERQATREGISVAAYLRRMLLIQVEATEAAKKDRVALLGKFGQ